MKLYVSMFASALLMLSLQAYAGQNAAEALCAAARSGNIEEVRLLLKADVAVNERFLGWSPLVQATYGGHLAVVRLLLKHGAVVNIGRCGFSALGVAAASDHVDVARVLLEHDADIEDGYCCCSCLAGQGCNSQERCNQIMRHFKNYLCETGRTCDMERDSRALSYLLLSLDDAALGGNKQALSPLVLAVARGNAAMIRMLLEHGAKVTPVRASLLGVAFSCGTKSEDLLRVLMEYEVPKPLQAYKLRELFRAVMKVPEAKLLQPFLEYGVPLTGKEEFIKEFIQDRESMNQGKEFCRELIERGVDLEERWWWDQELPKLHEIRLHTVADCLNQARVPADVARVIAHMSGQSDEQVNCLHELVR